MQHTTPNSPNQEKKLTPGPWAPEKSGGRGSWIKGSNGEWAALACGDTDERAEANALAIAALPDLIEAAENIVCGLEEFEAEALNGDIGGGWPRDCDEDFVITYSEACALRDVLSRIQGGK